MLVVECSVQCVIYIGGEGEAPLARRGIMGARPGATSSKQNKTKQTSTCKKGQCPENGVVHEQIVVVCFQSS